MRRIWTEAELAVREKIKREDLEKQALYRQELRKHPRLRYLFVELTDQCNLSCLHCGSKCSVQNASHIDTKLLIDTLETVVQDFEASRIMICLTGGEPMLHPHFEEILENINRLGFPWGMTTNGTLIDGKMAKRLKELKMGSIGLSLDGLRDSHNWFRNAPYDNYKRTFHAIANLHEAGIPVQVTTVVHKKNIHELEGIYQELLNAKVESWRPINIEPIGRALDNDELLLNHRELIELLEFIREKRFAAGRTGMDVHFGCSHYLTSAYERDVRDSCFMCASGIQVASILCNGDIYSCLDIERRPELVQGNVKIDRFSEVWIHKFKEFREDRSEKCDMCSACEDRHFCAGDSAHTWDYDKNQPMLCFAKILREEQNN